MDKDKLLAEAKRNYTSGMEVKCCSLGSGVIGDKDDWKWEVDDLFYDTIMIYYAHTTEWAEIISISKPNLKKLTKEDLVEGTYYYNAHDNWNYGYVICHLKSDYFSPEKRTYFKGLYRNSLGGCDTLRLATQEEITWFRACQTANKFVDKATALNNAKESKVSSNDTWYKDLNKGDCFVCLDYQKNKHGNKNYVYELYKEGGSDVLYIESYNSKIYDRCRKATDEETDMYKDAGEPVDITTYKMKDNKGDQSVTIEDKYIVGEWYRCSADHSPYRFSKLEDDKWWYSEYVSNWKVEGLSNWAALSNMHERVNLSDYIDEPKPKVLDIDSLIDGEIYYEESHPQNYKWVFRAKDKDRAYSYKGLHKEGMFLTDTHYNNDPNIRLATPQERARLIKAEQEHGFDNSKWERDNYWESKVGKAAYSFNALNEEPLEMSREWFKNMYPLTPKDCFKPNDSPLIDFEGFTPIKTSTDKEVKIKLIS